MEPFQELLEPGSTRTLTWKMAYLRLNLLDQSGEPIPGSKFVVPASYNFPTTVVTGDSLRLPVTEDPSAPAPSGSLSGGYDLWVDPGLSGNQQTGVYLRRMEPFQELLETGSTRTSTWDLCTGTLQILNSTGFEAAGSAIILGVVGVI